MPKESKQFEGWTWCIPVMTKKKEKKSITVSPISLAFCINYPLAAECEITPKHLHQTTLSQQPEAEQSSFALKAFGWGAPWGPCSLPPHALSLHFVKHFPPRS